MDHSSASPAMSGLTATTEGVSKRLTTDGIADSWRTMRSAAARNDLAARGSLIALTSTLLRTRCDRRVMGDISIGAHGVSRQPRLLSLHRLCVRFDAVARLMFDKNAIHGTRKAYRDRAIRARGRTRGRCGARGIRGEPARAKRIGRHIYIKRTREPGADFHRGIRVTRAKGITELGAVRWRDVERPEVERRR